MPALRNKRHERFAQLVHRHGIARRAYAEAGYHARKALTPAQSSPLDAAAARLLKSVAIQQRLSELAAMTMQRHQVTIDSLLQQLAEDRALAHREGQSGGAVQATATMARLVGLMVDRKETGAPGDFAALQTTDEIVDALRKLAGDEAADALAGLLARQPAETASELPASDAVDLEAIRPANERAT